jgi:hypothetical protein
MKQIMWGIALAISLVGWRGLSAQSKSPRVMAEITGASLKWILAAEPKFQREKLDLDKYVVSVVEQGDSIIVELRSFDSVKRGEGKHGKLSGIRGRNPQEGCEGCALQLCSMIAQLGRFDSL